MTIQEIIVYLILASVAIVCIRYIYLRITDNNRNCNCNSCPMHGGECHCENTQN